MRSRACWGSRFAEELDCSEAGAKEAGEDAEEGGFAGAVFADEDVALAGFEVDGDLAQGGEGSEEARKRYRLGRRGPRLPGRSWAAQLAAPEVAATGAGVGGGSGGVGAGIAGSGGRGGAGLG